MSLQHTLKRFGITTSAAAAAAAKAALIYLLRGQRPESVTIPTPIGLRIEIFVENYELVNDSACAEVRKFSGDNVDVLDGVVIRSCVKVREDGLINIVGGKGVGIVTKPGLNIPVGESAISPAAKDLITKAVKEVLSKGIGVDVVVEVPGGEDIAKETMNEALGILNGISIIGTTGIEWPVSNDDDIHRISNEVAVIRRNSDLIVIATGNRSWFYASKIFDPSIIIKVGDNVGFAIETASRLQFKKIVVATQPSKVLKLAAGIMNTSSRVGDARIEVLTFHCVLSNLDADLVKSVAKALTVREALLLLGDKAKLVYRSVVLSALKHIRKRFGSLHVEIIVFDDNGDVLAEGELS